MLDLLNLQVMEKPVYLYDKGCVGSKAYKNLTEEYLTKQNDKFTKLN